MPNFGSPITTTSYSCRRRRVLDSAPFLLLFFLGGGGGGGGGEGGVAIMSKRQVINRDVLEYYSPIIYRQFLLRRSIFFLDRSTGSEEQKETACSPTSSGIEIVCGLQQTCIDTC